MEQKNDKADQMSQRYLILSGLHVQEYIPSHFLSLHRLLSIILQKRHENKWVDYMKPRIPIIKLAYITIPRTHTYQS